MRLALTKRGEYGVRIMLYLASLPEGKRVTAGDLAETCDVPPGNVPTIMNILSRARLLMCTPGRGGGCTLARAPEEISMLEIIEAIEGELSVPHCLLDSRRCHGRDSECAMHSTWSKARNTAMDALAGVTLRAAQERDKEIAGELARKRARRGGSGSAAAPRRAAVRRRG